jgi:hypothetical protein
LSSIVVVPFCFLLAIVVILFLRLIVLFYGLM